LKKALFILVISLFSQITKAQMSIAYSIGVLGGDLSISNSSSPLTMSMNNCIQVTNGVAKFTTANNEAFINNCVVDLNYSKISIQVLPNPFVNAVYVTFKSKIDNDNHFKISVFNNIGQLVKMENVYQDLFYSGYKISMSSIPTGIYFLQINSSKVNETFKIVKNE
jgi:hypothetical protein